jgi:hypothetical protein
MGFSALPQAHDPDHKEWTQEPSFGQPGIDRRKQTFTGPTDDSDTARYVRNHINAQASLTPCTLPDPIIPAAIAEIAFNERCHRAIYIANSEPSLSHPGRHVDLGLRPPAGPPNAAGFFADMGDVINAYRYAVDNYSTSAAASHKPKSERAATIMKAAKTAAHLTVNTICRYSSDNINSPDHEAAAIAAAWHVLQPLIAPDASTAEYPADFENRATDDEDRELIDQWNDDYPYDDGTVEWGILEIQHKPLTDALPHKLRKTRRSRLTDAGAAIRRPDRIITDGKAFSQIRRHKSKVGTLLIDTSGSMHLSRHQILEVMTACPAVTIATYSGAGNEGQLFIVAKHGRYSSAVIEPHYGGNVVDGPCLDWLAAQPGPRVWVSDAMVTGRGDRTSATLLLDALGKVRSKNIVRYANVQNLIADISEPSR